MQNSDAQDSRNTTTARGNERRRVALTPHKQEIEQWVRQEHSDEWIANALGTTPSSVQSFRSRHDIYRASKQSSYSRSGAEAEAEPNSSVYEGVLEHGEGESGYGLWLDPVVADNPVFQRGFAGVADVEVSIERDRIVLTPAPRSEEGAESGESSSTPADSASWMETVFGSENLGSENVRRRSSGAEGEPNSEKGTVKWFEPAKGFGFLYRPDGSDIFVHKSQIKNGQTLSAGEEVRYEVGRNSRGLVASDVRSVS